MSEVTPARIGVLIDYLGRDGGFVFNTVHNIQARTPVANIVAMLSAIREFNAAGG